MNITPEMERELKVEGQKARQRAQEDIQDIESLAGNSAFNRYWVRRLGELHNVEVNKALHAKTAEEREGARHRAIILRELADMPAQDRQQCEKFLRTPDAGPRLPTQAG